MARAWESLQESFQVIRGVRLLRIIRQMIINVIQILSFGLVFIGAQDLKYALFYKGFSNFPRPSLGPHTLLSQFSSQRTSTS